MLNFEPPRSNVVITGRHATLRAKSEELTAGQTRSFLLSTFGGGAILKEEEEEEAITKGWRKMGPEEPKPITHMYIDKNGQVIFLKIEHTGMLKERLLRK